MGGCAQICRGGWLTAPKEGVRWLVVSACLAVVCGSVLTLAAPAAADTPLSWKIVNVDGTNAINSISCPASSLCVAVDNNGNVLTSTNPIGGRSAWSAPVTIDTGGLDGSSLNAVSCPSISLCVAVDESGRVLTSTKPTGGKSAWSAAVRIDDVGNGDSDDLADVSCASPSLCVAVDRVGYVFTSTNPTGGAAAWSTGTSVGSGNGIRYSVSCPSASAAFCAVVGNSDVWTSINAGGSWSEPGTPIDTLHGDLQAVGCSSSSLCVAGEYAGGNIFASTNPTGGASAWTEFHSSENTINGISCRGSFCAVVGVQGSGYSGDSDVFTSSNPTGGASAWSTTSIDNDELLDISCVSSSLCVASDAEGNVVVGFSLQPQTISLSVPAQSTVGSSALLSPTASSNLPVVLKLDAKTTNHACSLSGLSGDTVSFNHVGSCVLDANQSGGSGYSPAPQVQKTIVVGKASQTIAFSAPSGGTVGGSVWLSPSASSGLTPVLSVDKEKTTNSACSVSGDLVSFNHAGSCVLDANQAGNADYAAAPQVQKTITVGKASQTIAFSAPSGGTVGGSTVLDPTASSGLPVVLSVDATKTTDSACSLSVSGGKVSFNHAGSCVLDANQAGNADYAAAPQVQRTITVTQASNRE
jgi:hypothetical protein